MQSSHSTRTFLLQRDTQRLSHLARVSRNLQAEDLDRARAGPRDAVDHSQAGGLARAVWAEKSEAQPAWSADVEIANRGPRAAAGLREGLRQAGKAHGRRSQVVLRAQERNPPTELLGGHLQNRVQPALDSGKSNRSPKGIALVVGIPHTEC